MIENTYRGVLTQTNVIDLANQISAKTRNARGVILRYDTALVTWHEPPIVTRSLMNVRAHRPPMAMIVTPEVYPIAVLTCRQMAQFGTLQTVWLAQHLEMARNWLEMQETQ